MSFAKYGATVPEFIKRYREHKGMSQGDLAKALGVHAQYVSNIERGVNEFPAAFIGRILKHLAKEGEGDRLKYLTDLMIELQLDILSDRMGVKDEIRKSSQQRVKTKIRRATRK